MVDVGPLAPSNPLRLLKSAREGDTARLRGALGQNDDPNQRDKCGATPLMHAVWNGHGRCVRALLRGGSDLDARSSKSGDTALHYACERGYFKIAEYLLSAGASGRTRNLAGFRAADMQRDVAVESGDGEGTMPPGSDGERDAAEGEERTAARFAARPSVVSNTVLAATWDAMQRAMSAPIGASAPTGPDRPNQRPNLALPGIVTYGPTRSARAAAVAEQRQHRATAQRAGPMSQPGVRKRVARRRSAALSVQEFVLKPRGAPNAEVVHARRPSVTSNVIIKTLKNARRLSSSKKELLGAVNEVAGGGAVDAEVLAKQNAKLAAMTKAANSAVYYTNRATMNADGVSLKEIFETVASGGWIRSSAQLLMSLQVLGGEDVELDSLPGYVADASEGGIFINFRQFCTYAEYVGKLNGKQFGGSHRGSSAVSPRDSSMSGRTPRAGSISSYGGHTSKLSQASIQGRVSEAGSSEADPGEPRSFGENPPLVFLGGACNPTTWRAKYAIPVLNEEGIT